jgi:hypothetical protein
VAADIVPCLPRSGHAPDAKGRLRACIETTDGNFSKVEVRVLFIWKDGEPFPVTTLARLSQGKMMGVNFNKDRTWVGSSGCLWPGEKV